MKKKKKGADVSLLDDIEKRVFEMLPDSGSVSVDSLSSPELPTSEVMGTLTMLEIKGFVEALPGGFYAKK